MWKLKLFYTMNSEANQISLLGSVANARRTRKAGFRLLLGLAASMCISLFLSCQAVKGQSEIIWMTNEISEVNAGYNVLVNLYNSTGGNGWYENCGWLETNARFWSGVGVSNLVAVDIVTNIDPMIICPPHLIYTGIIITPGYVSSIELGDNNLIGSIPYNIMYLFQLQYLDLDSNYLSNSIPDSLGNLTQLQYLDLSYNNLSGSIPDSLANLTQLQYLNLSGNSLSGEVPDFTAITNCYINISGNYLDITAGSQSLNNINAMIAAGNTVIYTPQFPLPTIQNPQYRKSVFSFSWPSVPGQSYQVQYTGNLSAGFWSNLGNQIIANDTMTGISISNTTGNAEFYRVISAP